MCRFIIIQHIIVYQLIKKNFKLLILSTNRDMTTHGNSFIASSYLSFGVNEIANNLKPDAIF